MFIHSVNDPTVHWTPMFRSWPCPCTLTVKATWGKTSACQDPQLHTLFTFFFSLFWLQVPPPTVLLPEHSASHAPQYMTSFTGWQTIYWGSQRGSFAFLHLRRFYSSTGSSWLCSICQGWHVRIKSPQVKTLVTSIGSYFTLSKCK